MKQESASIQDLGIRPAHTWDEIGEALGYPAGFRNRHGAKLAFETYCRAIKKLRARPASLEKLRQIAIELDKVRGMRCGVERVA
jgi:hypothetical protein